MSAVAVGAAVALAACGADEPLAHRAPARKAPAPQVARNEELQTATSDDDGTYRVTFSLPADSTSFQIDLINITNDIPVSVHQLTDPSGAVVLTDANLDARRVPSPSLLVQGTQAQLSYPVLPAGEPLPAGEWTLAFGLYDFSGARVRMPDVDVEIRINTKNDPDIAVGAVNVHVVYVDGIEGDAALVAGVDAAIAQWQEFARATQGLTVNVRTSAADDLLAPPYAGDGVFVDLSVAARPYELTVLVGETFPDANLLGQAGGIPGALTPSARSGIAVAARNVAGVDGELDDSETTMLAWVFAHEVGHYLGLRHVVESDYQTYDGLSDTPECSGEQACRRALSTNVMFPFVSTIDGLAALKMSDQQDRVAQHAVAVD